MGRLENAESCRLGDTTTAEIVTGFSYSSLMNYDAQSCYCWRVKSIMNMVRDDEAFHLIKFSNLISSFDIYILLELLSTVQPEFKHNGQTFTNCLLLHRLLVTGGEEELLRTKQKLSSSILSHTCQYKEGSDTHTKVSVIFSPPFTIPTQVTALHLAARFTSASVVRAIVESGSNVNACDDLNQTPLHYAAQHNNVDVVKILIENTGNMKRDQLQTLLLLAAEHNPRPDVVKLLINNGANVTAALQMAVQQKNANVVKMLIENSANIENGQLQALLLLAAEHNSRPDVVKLLINNGANVRAALLVAVQEKNANVVKMLIDNGADVKAVGKDKLTPLHIAAEHNSSADVITALLDKGADIEARDDGQCTPLHLAARSNPGQVKILLESGANVNVLSRGQKSPLYYAALNNNREAIIELCKAGAKPLLGDNPLGGNLVADKMRQLIKEKLSL